MYRNDDELQSLGNQIHRTWLELLLVENHRAIAAVALDSTLELIQDQEYENYDAPTLLFGAVVNVPARYYSTVRQDDLVRKLLKDTLFSILEGYIEVDSEVAIIRFRAKLQDPEGDWYNIVQHMITEMSDPNQALVTEKVFKRDGREPIVYNEMKFGSQSEIRIAQEFEARKILFFPLPLAVRHETGQFYKDHREVDFLVCENGQFGILEVAYHVDRYEKDQEKSAWFKRSGILCVESRPAETCFNSPAKVVDEFLDILRQHRSR